MASSPDSETAHLADQLERSVRGGAWHGPALAEVCAGLDGESAARRPLPEAHTAREIVDHVAYWLDGARRRIENGEGADSGSDPDDWPAGGDDPERAWRAALDRLESSLRALRSTLLGLDDARLDAPVAGSDPTVRGMLLGLLQHNAYHAGQLLLIGRAARGKPS